MANKFYYFLLLEVIQVFGQLMNLDALQQMVLLLYEKKNRVLHENYLMDQLKRIVDNILNFLLLFNIKKKH